MTNSTRLYDAIASLPSLLPYANGLELKHLERDFARGQPRLLGPLDERGEMDAGQAPALPG